MLRKFGIVVFIIIVYLSIVAFIPGLFPDYNYKQENSEQIKSLNKGD